jgi:hypothetical protein
LQIKTKNVSCHTADSKPVKQEVNGTMILPPLVFPVQGDESLLCGAFNQILSTEMYFGSVANVKQLHCCNLQLSIELVAR